MKNLAVFAAAFLASLAVALVPFAVSDQRSTVAQPARDIEPPGATA